MVEKQIRFPEFAGQANDVVLTKRKDGSRYVTFEHATGYGYAALSLEDMKLLVEEMEKM